VEAKIRIVKKEPRNENEHLGRLSREAKMYAEEEEAIREEKKELLASIQELNDKEEERTRKIARLAERVRRTVGEVCVYGRWLCLCLLLASGAICFLTSCALLYALSLIVEEARLRRSVQEAKEEFQEANAEMLRWEEGVLCDWPGLR
jgi:DNA repair exonuclease SbcCD ATPase subunit